MLQLFHRICTIVPVIFLTLFATPLVAKEAQKHSDEEAFLIRRIAEFWKDGDFSIVKVQIVDFLDQYPKSELKDYFLGILGDIYLQENDYERALTTYQNIQDYGVIEKTLLNKLQCYYELDQFQNLAEDGRPFLTSKAPDIQQRKEELYFLMGEALFRRALSENSPELKLELAREARSYYQNLPTGQYEEVSAFALAEIAAMVGDFERAAQAYHELAEKHADMKEDLLFQAATLEAKYNKLGALETFRAIKNMEGARENEATFNLIVLLFQNEAYEEILSTYEKIASTVPEKYLPTFHFIVGKSFFSTSDYEHAIEPLNRYIQSTYLPSDQLKNALLIQMTCAHQTQNESLFNEAFEKLDSLFPNDAEIPKALFMHAMLLKEQGAISQADEKLRMIKETYHEFKEQEAFLFEYGLLAYQNERWKESYDAFKSYVSTYEGSPRINSAWKLLLSSSIHYFRQDDGEGTYSKPAFFVDLQEVLNHSGFLSRSEMVDFSLLYAKTAYELDFYSEALHCLQDNFFTHQGEKIDSHVLAEAHFIAGLCHAEMRSDHSAFCMHLEEAMTLHPDLYDSAPTHLQLYNAYISLAGYGEYGATNSDHALQKEFVDHAAEHLQEAISKGNIAIKDENRLWLANHYYQIARENREHPGREQTNYPEVSYSIDHAIALYEGILMHNNHLISLNSENLHLENEAIKLSKLYEYQAAHNKRLTLIKELLEQQSHEGDLHWNAQREALFELANVYVAMGEKEKAYETYNFIHGSGDHFPTSLANQATLEAARLHFELLDPSLKKEDNQEVLSILNRLKELQIRKNASSEPTHLEAALEYARIRSSLSRPDEKDHRYLFFLSRIKDDFTSQEDLVTQDYLVSLNQNSEKKKIFDAYMKFIDAETMRLKAKHFHKAQELGEMEELHENALSLYNEIAHNRYAPRELTDRIAKSVEAINALNVY